MMGAEPAVAEGSVMDINAAEAWAVNRACALLLAMTCDATATLTVMSQTHERQTEGEAT